MKKLTRWLMLFASMSVPSSLVLGQVPDDAMSLKFYECEGITAVVKRQYDITNQAVLNALVNKIVAAHKAACPQKRGLWINMWYEGNENKHLSEVDGQFSVGQNNEFRFHGGVAFRQRDQKLEQAKQEQLQSAARQGAAQERQRKEMAQSAQDQRAQSFADRYGATGGWVKWSQFKSNPFSYEGKALLFNAEFIRMVSPTSAMFESMVVSDIPRNAFTQPGRVLLAGKVLGTTNVPNQFGGQVSLPHVKYSGHIICETQDCNGHYGGSVSAR